MASESACRRCDIGLEIDVSRRLLLCFYDYGRGKPLTAAVPPHPPPPFLLSPPLATILISNGTAKPLPV